MSSSASHPNGNDDEPVIPVIEERARVGSTRRETGAVRIRLETVDEVSSLALERVEEQTRVERVPVGAVVEQRRAPWWQGETLVVPVYAERAVVERRLVLVEEIRVHRTAVRTTSRVDVPLARQRAIVERLTPQGDWAVVDDDDASTGASD